jgi:hypothetical protein
MNLTPLKLIGQVARNGVLGSCLLLLLAASTAQAQETTAAPGSPSATTTIPGNQLPPPPQKFEGKIERNAAQSTPYWPARVVPPKGAPNILPCSGRGSAQVFLRRVGLGQDLQSHGGGMDMGFRHAVLLDQADRLALGRRTAGHGDLVARSHQGQGRYP